MVRLCFEDKSTFAKYKKGILHTNLSLLSVPDDKSFRVHTSELNEIQ